MGHLRGFLHYVTRWGARIRNETKRHREHIHNEQYRDSDGGSDGIQSGDDEDDEDADKAAKSGDVVSMVGQMDDEPEVRGRISRELANWALCWPFQVTYRWNGSCKAGSTRSG